jgi:hypothetical protein
MDQKTNSKWHKNGREIQFYIFTVEENVLNL